VKWQREVMEASLSRNTERAAFYAAAVHVLDRIVPTLIDNVRAEDDTREAFWLAQRDPSGMPFDSDTNALPRPGNGAVQE
jgi:hypothetical protein